LYSEIMAVYCEERTKHRTILYEQMMLIRRYCTVTTVL